MAGGKAPSADRVVKLAEALNISSSYIFTGVEMTKDDEEFLRLVSQMSAEEKRHLLGLLSARK